MPPHDADDEHRADKDQRVVQRGQKVRIIEERGVVLQPDEAHVVRIEQTVAQGREIERHDQRHDHPDEEQDDRRRDQSAACGGGLLRRHPSWPSRVGHPQSSSTAKRQPFPPIGLRVRGSAASLKRLCR